MKPEFCSSRNNYKQNLVDLLESVFHLCMHGCTYTELELCLYDQLDIASLLLVSLLFIAVPTPF